MSNYSVATYEYNKQTLFYMQNTRIKYGIVFHIYFLEENHCHPNPCRNAGVCTEADGAFVCTCSEGFKGVNCEGM